MTKLQTWNAAMAIINDTTFKSNAAKETAIKRFEELLAPKKGGSSSRPVPLELDGITYYFCRFTGLYFPASEMVYQNDEHRTNAKDKGYSNIGISLWSKADKYIKEIKMKSVEIAYGDDQTDETRARGLALMNEAKLLEKNNSKNDAAYLMEHFLSDEQADILEGLELPTPA